MQSYDGTGKNDKTCVRCVISVFSLALFFLKLKTVQVCGHVPSAWSSLSVAGAVTPAAQGRASAWRAPIGAQ